MKTFVYAADPQHVLIDGKREIHGGEEFTVGDDRAQQLLDQGIPLRAAASDPRKAKREELNLLAEQAGVDSPADLPSKDAVIQAIEEANASQNQPAAITGEGHNSTKEAQ